MCFDGLLGAQVRAPSAERVVVFLLQKLQVRPGARPAGRGARLLQPGCTAAPHVWQGLRLRELRGRSELHQPPATRAHEYLLLSCVNYLCTLYPRFGPNYFPVCR